jgi:fructokinase
MAAPSSRWRKLGRGLVVIVVCGEALIDMIHSGDGSRRAEAGGGPFNTARALGRLGVPAAFMGHLSEDAFGRELAGLLEADGAGLELATFGPEPTTIALADVDSAGLAEYRFLVQGTSAPKLTFEMLPEHLPPEVDGIHLGTLGLVLEPMASTLCQLVRREHSRRLVMLDPNVRPGLVPDDEYRERLHEIIGLSTIVKASDADLAWLYADLDYESAAEQILGAGVRMAVVTLGTDGAFGAHRDFRLRVPAPNVEVVDTIGAGDAFGAALLAWLHDNEAIRPDLRLERSEVQAALELACLAAAITCTRAGADPPRRSDLAFFSPA